ncbi:MAG: proline dehydrogenase family protein [Candidatus Korobacteraceae bacterium]
MSRRFVAGLTIEDMIAAVEEMNRRGIRVSIDHLGENVTSCEEAVASANYYHQLLEEIDRRKLDSNVSLKLTQMGLDQNPELASRLVGELVQHAVQINNFIRIDMEGSAYTQRTLDMTRELHRLPGAADHVGTVLQAYMRRALEDARLLVSEGIRIRLCKGAYLEPEEIAFRKMPEVDANYIRVARLLLKSGTFHGIATHDEPIINELTAWAKSESISPASFEFQMLYGIRRDLQEKLVRDGWGGRVYRPFGSEWYPYFMRRLAERPANLWFIVKNALRG